MKHYLQTTIFRLLLAAVMVYLLPMVVWGQGIQPDGDGGSEDNPYQISIREHLEWMADQTVNQQNTFKDKYFKLMNDIDLSDKAWETPIGKYKYKSNTYFAGVFDGNGYRITGLTTPATAEYAGLFGCVGERWGSTGTSIIKNLAVEIAEEGLHITSDWGYAGGIAAGAYGKSTITNCSVTGGGICCEGIFDNCAVKAGGIVGDGDLLTIKNCYSTVNILVHVVGTTYLGADNGVFIAGIVGMSQRSNITNCFYTGKLGVDVADAEKGYPFSLAGITVNDFNNPSSSPTVTNCLVSSPEGFVLTAPQSPDYYSISKIAAITFQYYYDNVSKNYVSPATTIIGSKPTYDDQKNGTEWLDMADSKAPISVWVADGWKVSSNVNYMPILLTTDGNEFKTPQPAIFKTITSITTADELAAINTDATSLSGSYVLANDIDLTGYISNNGGSWKPIGSASAPFLGVFNGNGHRITGLAIAEGKTGSGEGGLFGVVGQDGFAGSETTIKNLGVEIASGGIHINTDIENGGGVASNCYNCKIQNCYVTGGAIYGVGTASSAGTLSLGGIAGSAGKDATIEHCYSTIDIKAEWDNPQHGSSGEGLYLGGIVGDASNGTLINCFSSGAISAPLSNVSDGDFKVFVGGIAAYNSTGCTVKNCLAVNYGGFTVETDIPASANVNSTMGMQGTGTFADNYALTGIPKTDGVTSTDGLAGTGWDGVSAYPAGIFDNDNWQTSATNMFPKLCYAGTATLLPNQPDVLRLYQVSLAAPVANGTFSVSSQPWVKAGEVVIITTVPEDNYQVDGLPTVIGNSGNVTVTGSNNSYTFTMPAEAVEVTVAFSEIPAPPTPTPDPDPDPTPVPPVYHTVIVPAVEGATTDPIAGDYEVEAWSSFRFYLTLDKDYDLSEPVVTTDRGETIEPRSSDGAYIVKYVRSDVQIFIDGVVKNPDPVANETIEVTSPKIWTENGSLHIQAVATGKVYVYTTEGKLQTARKLEANETYNVYLPTGVYLVVIGNERFKVVI